MKHLYNLANIIRSIYFNFRYLPFSQAIYLPVYITWNISDIKLKRGQLIIKKPFRKSIIIGFGGSPGLQCFRGSLYLGSKSSIIFNGFTVISEGSSIRCDKNSHIEFGENFYCNKNCFIRSSSNISFGKNCLLGWNIQINDNDGHTICHDEKWKTMTRPIKIGNRVWCTSNAIITKGVTISDGCVIAQGAVVTKDMLESNSLIGGIPANIIKKGIRWDK